MAKNFEIIFNMDEPMLNANGDKIQWSKDAILNVLEGHNCKYIISPHIPDEVSNFNHLHVGIHTSSNNEYATIAKWFNLGVNSVQKIQKSFQTTYALYLIHYNNKDGKTPVDPSKVINNFGLDYSKLIKNVEGANRLEDVLVSIDSGKIKQYNLHEFVSINEYVKWKRQIDNAFKYRVDKIKGIERNMDCVFVTGASGSGKTTFAKKLAKDKNYSCYISSGSNDLLDDYAGQECIILDDLRSECLGVSDLLKMLDNNTASTVKSRFKNKVLECKLIIITTTKSIDQFFNDIFSDPNDRESIVQLKRRCETYIDMQEDSIKTFVYDKALKEYVFAFECPNVVLMQFEEIERLTAEQRKQKAVSILGGLGQMFVQSASFVEGFTPDKK